MIILDMPQRSDLWFSVRSGRPTASNAGKILTSTGKTSTQRNGYLWELVAERGGYGKPPFEPTEAMLEGIRREEEARNAYAFMTGTEPYEVGMIICPKTGASASPDGLIPQDMIDIGVEALTKHDCWDYGLEIKNPMGSTFFAEKHAGKVPANYLPQIHMSMAVSGLDRWDYCCYLPGQDLIIHTVERSELTEAFESAIADFCNELNERTKEMLPDFDIEQHGTGVAA